jgi:hypothetical protein
MSKNYLQVNSKTYDVLKWVALILLPALAVFYTAISGTMPHGLPYTVEVVKTITALDAFLGILLGISTAQYNSGRPTSMSVESVESVDGVIDNKTYDILKFVAQIFLPAFATLYFTIGSTWGLQNPEQVVAIIMAVDSFLGMMLDFNNNQLSAG